MSVLSWLANASGLLAAIVLLWKGADWFVDAAVRIARRFRVSDLVIGLTLVGLGTSAPEFAVSIGAALTERANISVANVVGSNVFNLGFILGGCALIAPIVTSRTLVFRDGVFLLAVTLLLAWFIRDLRFARYEGIILMSLLAAYIVFLFVRREPLDQAQTEESPAGWVDGIWAVVGLAMILGGAHLLVETASSVARNLGVSEWAIGVTVVAAGTSAPELVTSLNAAVKSRYGISAGNLLGSDLFNLLGVLGLAATIRPLGVSAGGPMSVHVLTLMVLMVVVFMRSGWRLSRAEGGLLVGINLVRWAFEIGGGRV